MPEMTTTENVQIRLTTAQRDAMTAGEWYRSQYDPQRRLTATGGSGRCSSINVRTMRRLAEYGCVVLRETYSRQDGGNVWTATMTADGEAVREQIIREETN